MKCVFCLLQNRAQHTLNVISHCIVRFAVDMRISLRLKMQSLSLLGSSCDNFRPLAEMSRCLENDSRLVLCEFLAISKCISIIRYQKGVYNKTKYLQDIIIVLKYRPLN